VAPESQNPAGTIAGLILVGIFLWGAFTGSSNDGAISKPGIKASSEYGLTIYNDGYGWDRASYQERMWLCQSFVKPMDQFPGRRDAKWYYDLLYTYYSGNPHKSTTIQDVVTLGVAMHASP